MYLDHEGGTRESVEVELPRFDDVRAGQVRGWLLGVGGSVPQPIPRTGEQGERIGYWRASDVLQRDPDEVLKTCVVRARQA